MAALLDVNALIALVDENHTQHETMRRWFRSHHQRGWATCPITENGMVRVLSQPAYPGGLWTPADIVQILTSLKKSFAKSHQFWPDAITLCDAGVFDHPLLTGSKHVIDAYLLALAKENGGTLVSFDRGLPWHAIRHGSAKLVVVPE
ncbi:MAG: TA system VapC family ribonuclease toxin [Bryobacteraceae bacterium]